MIEILRTIIRYLVRIIIFSTYFITILFFNIKNPIYIIGLGIFFVFLYFQNESIKITNYIIKNKDLPNNHDNIKIMHISDLHNKRYGIKQRKIKKKLNKIEVDAIFITGDTVDEKHDINARNLIKFLVEKAPVYFITGNHEYDICEKSYSEFEKFLRKEKVNILRNQCLNINGLNIIGVDDYKLEGKEKFEERLHNLSKEKGFKLLLSHRPEFMPLYAKHGYNLIFSGHAHGGQFRIPKIGALGAPGQKFFPKYAEGVISEKDSTIIISRGLGDSLIPQRLFNRPEIVIATLQN